MTSDPFPSDSRFERLPIAGAEVSYLPRLDLDAAPAAVLDRLIREVPWRSESIVLWGKKTRQPRLIAWYGDPGRAYAYSGLRLDPLPWSPLLLGLKRRVSRAAGASFNSVLLNYYRDQNDSMGMHSDDEPELGAQPVIASLSLGERRAFVLKPRRDRSLKPVRVPLTSGSLLVMRGDTQRNWKHGIEKQRQPCGPRVNLTFRQIRDPA